MMAGADTPGFVERRSTWSFTVNGGRWVWSVIRPDKSHGASESLFDSLTECIEDATRHGYVPLKPQVDRRGQASPDAEATEGSD